MGPNGSQVAATQIQSSWRRYRDRSQYLEYRRLKWAAGVIAISWIMHIKMAKMRQQLRETRARQLENFKQRAKVGRRFVMVAAVSAGWCETTVDWTDRLCLF